MKILILNWRDTKHPLAGGAEISTHEHAKRWAKSGHEVIQFSSAFPGAKSIEIVDKIKIIRQGNYFTVHLRAFFYHLKYLRGKIDLIIDEFHFIPFFTPLYSRVKKIAFIHETAEEIWFKNQPFPINVLGFFLEPFFFKLYKNVPFMTVSDSTKKDLMRFGIKDKNIYVINNGVKVKSSYCEKEEKPTIIYLGRLAEDKGTKQAIIAFYEIQKTFKNAVLWVVGREEKRGLLDNLKQTVKDLHLDNKVIFFDYVSEGKKFDLLKKAWILVHPSIKEGWGLTVMEAASQRTPTVAYDIPGLRDSIIDNKTGILVRNRQPIELAKAIIKILNDPSLHERLSKNAFDRSKSFSWEKSTKQSLSLIEKIL